MFYALQVADRSSDDCYIVDLRFRLTFDKWLTNQETLYVRIAFVVLFPNVLSMFSRASL